VGNNAGQNDSGDEEETGKGRVWEKVIEKSGWGSNGSTPGRTKSPWLGIVSLGKEVTLV